MSRRIKGGGRLLALILGLNTGPGAAVADTPRLDAHGTVKVAICQMAVDLGPWMGIIGPALARPLAADDVSGVEIKRGVACGALHVETACFAGVLDGSGKGIACSPQSLLQLVRSSAWYALMRRRGEGYESFRLRMPDPVNVAAFHFADGSTADATLEARLAALPHTEEMLAGDEAARTFMITLNLVFAAVFGHEDSHLYEKTPYCGLSELSDVEASGLYRAIGRVQSSGELFKSNDPSPAEVNADRCATRRIKESVERYVRSLPSNVRQDLHFARRAAADIVAVVLLVHEGSAHPPIDASPVDGYLYPALRILALAGELDGDAKPIVCGAAAETFVQTTQMAFQALPGNGILPDDLQAALPSGVADAWNRKAHWSPQSFSCPELN
jgi:hypothetical protein